MMNQESAVKFSSQNNLILFSKEDYTYAVCQWSYSVTWELLSINQPGDTLNYYILVHIEHF